MSKSFKLLGLMVLLIGLMAGSAFAGTTRSTNGLTGAAVNVVTLSLEAMGAARNVEIVSSQANITAAANGAITYTTSQNITSGNFLTTSFTGAAFTGNTYRVCKAGTNVSYATATPTAGTNSYNFQLTYGSGAPNDISSGDTLFLTSNGACNLTVGTNGSNNFILQVNAATTASAPTATIAIVSAGNLPVDTAGSANVASIVSEYTVTYNASNHTVDFLGTPGDGTRLLSAAGNSNIFAATNETAATNAIKIALTANNFTVAGGTGAAAPNAGLTASAVVSLIDSANWQGVSKVFLRNQGAANGNCQDNAGGNFVGSGSLNGTVALSVPTSGAGGFNGQAGANLALCVVGNGTTSLNTRTITANTAITVSSGGVSPAATGATTLDTWNLNAYQAMIPYSHTNSTVPSYCVINNMGATNVSVIYDVLSSEASLQSLSNTLGTVNNKTTALMTISGSTVTMAGSNTTVSLSALGTNTRHADRITVTGAPANINASCFQTDPTTGGKRNVLTLH